MKTKKLITGVLMMALLLTMLSVFSLPASAVSPNTSITVPVVNQKIGETAIVEIKMSGVVAGIRGKVAYDSSKLTLQGIMGNQEEVGLIYVDKEGATEDTISFAYAGAKNVELAQDTTILTLTFSCDEIGEAPVVIVDKEVRQAPETGSGSIDVSDKCNVTNGKVVIGEEDPEVYATEITAKPAALSLGINQSTKLEYGLEPADSDDTITFSSSDESVVMVDSHTGEVKAVGPGTATITISGKNTSAQCTVTIYKYIALRINMNRAVVDGLKTVLDDMGTVPYLKGIRTMVPVRFVTEKMGGRVDYVSDKDPIVMTYGNKRIEIRLNSKTMVVYTGDKKETITIDEAAEKRGSRTFVPLRAVSQALGFDVYYQNNTKLILVNNPSINANERDMRLNEAGAYITK